MFQRDVDYCSAAFLLTPRTVWQRFGGFDEAYKPAYYEETDYCIRLRSSGLRVVYDPNAVLIHHEFGSSGSPEAALELQRAHQQIFVKKHSTALQNQCVRDLGNVLEARMKTPGPHRVLFLDDRVPHRWLGSGFPRTHAILHTLVKQEYFVTFYPMSAPHEEWESVYSDMPRQIEFMMGYGWRMTEAFLRSRLGYYGTIIVSRPHNMGIVRTILSNHPSWSEKTKIIYDTEALFADREIQLRRLEGSPLSESEVNKLISDEVDLASAADCVISVSETDRNVFLRHGLEKVYVLGHAAEPRPAPRSFRERNGFLFVGAIHKERSPNADAAIWFLQNVLPKIDSALVNVRFTIAGVNNSESLRRLAPSTVTITGHRPDLSDLYDESRVFVAPMRYAAGIPHKVHEAAAYGLPVVTTPLLASQLGWDGAELSIGSDAESFARKCIELHTNETLWLNQREAALRRVATECSPAMFETRLKEVMTANIAK
jgi:glycosyltransferase involved in cell wall biosynthesis